MKQLENIIKKLEEKILELDIVLDEDIILEVSDILKESNEYIIPHRLKKFFRQFEILVEEIKRKEIKLEKETIHVLKLLLREIQRNREETMEEKEEISLMEEFLSEGKDIFQELKEKGANIGSLLHRLKGMIGIYMSICKEEEKHMGEKLLQKTRILEEKAKKEKLSKKEIEELESIFNGIREKYEKI